LLFRHIQNPCAEQRVCWIYISRRSFLSKH
jgi:hypothetical protein